MSGAAQIKICIICGRAVYSTEPQIKAKPQKGKTVYAHIKCVYAPTKCKGGAPNGKTKENR